MIIYKYSTVQQPQYSLSTVKVSGIKYQGLINSPEKYIKNGMEYYSSK